MAGLRIKYNPAFLTDEQLIDAFVVRHEDLRTILEIVRENVTGTNQHVLVTGPRGIGKTMLALRAAAEVRRDPELSANWYPLAFGEESYQVGTPGEFWLEAIFHLARQTKQERWKRTLEDLGEEGDEQRLRERALGQLMEFADEQGKRILLIVENLNMLLGDQISHDDAWVLRHTLLNEPRIMLLGTATRRFEEIENSGKAMFDLLKPCELQPLDQDQCRKVWAHVAGEELPGNRIRPIQILTGGSPRLLAIISSFGAKLSFRQLMQDLMQLVDDHTEYFKSHLDALPPTERKVYLSLAEIWDPAGAREVAERARLGVGKVSALLSRLTDRGAVVVADRKGRKKWYQVAERMYNIYYLMRRRGAPSSRVRAVVNFMVSFYDPEELVAAAKRIAEEACDLDPQARRDHFLLYGGILAQADDQVFRDRIVTATPRTFFEMPDLPSSIRSCAECTDEATRRADAISARGPGANGVPGDSVATPELGEERNRCLVLTEKADGLRNDATKLEEAERLYREALEIEPRHGQIWTKLATLLHYRLGRHEDAERAYRAAIELAPADAWAWAHLGDLLQHCAGRSEEAETAFGKAVALKPEDYWAWGHLGQCLRTAMHRYDEAETALRKAVEIDPRYAWGWGELGMLLARDMSKYEEAEAAFRKAIEIDEKDGWVWSQLGVLLHKDLHRYEEAEAAYRKAIALDPEHACPWGNLARLLHLDLGRYDEAEETYRRAIQLDRDQAHMGWIGLGRLFHHLKRYEEAEHALRKATQLKPSHAAAWQFLGRVLEEGAGRCGDAEKAYRKAIDLAPDVSQGWTSLGELLARHSDRDEEAEAAYRHAIELDPESPCPWAHLGALLADKFGRFEQAKAAFRKAIDLGTNCSWAWVKLGGLIHEHLGPCEEAESVYRRAIELLPTVPSLWLDLSELLLERPGGEKEALAVVEEALAKMPEDPSLLNNLAWSFYCNWPAAYLPRAEVWAQEAVSLEPDDRNCRHTLASVLCRLGKLSEAAELARMYLAEPEVVRQTVEDATSLFVDLAAAGMAQEAARIVQDSPSAEALEPLLVGLRLYLGEDVKAAAEILEIGKDVADRIRQRRQELEAERTQRQR